MSKYNWDIRALIAKRKEYKDKIDAFRILYTKEELRDLYEELYELYDQLIINYDIRCAEEEIDLTTTNYPNLTELKENIFDEVSEEKIQLVANAVNIGKHYKIKFKEPFFTVLPINDDEIIERTRFLYEQLPIKSFLDKFDKFTNPENHLLHIRYFQKLLTDYKGLAYVDTLNQTPYGLIARDNTIQDIITTSHEILHMIVREQEQPFFITTNKTVYTEVEGFFANLLFADMLQKQGIYNPGEIHSYSKRDLQSILDNCNVTFIAKSGMNLLKDGKINFSQLETILREKNILTPVNENNFPAFIDNETFENDLDLSISYLVALDLYYQYKQDPEKALHNLLTIPSLDGEQIKKDLETIDVTFFDDNYSNLNRHCKMLLKRNTTSKKK